jgi:hypothetical protein
VPPLLSGIQLITFFIDPALGNVSQENGKDWVLRAYPSLEGLVRIAASAGAPKVKRDSSAAGRSARTIPITTTPKW